MNWAIQRYWYTLIDIKITIYGGERVPHRLLSAPLALSANVFTSLTAHQFTVNGAKVFTILFNCFKGLAVFRDFIAPRR
jgi:hypothetical protein